jgi:hypothetical protein
VNNWVGRGIQIKENDRLILENRIIKEGKLILHGAFTYIQKNGTITTGNFYFDKLNGPCVKILPRCLIKIKNMVDGKQVGGTIEMNSAKYSKFLLDKELEAEDSVSSEDSQES